MNLTLYLRRPLDIVDKFLDGLTSYRLVLYFLYTAVGWAIILAAFNQLPFHWYAIGLSAAWLMFTCRVLGEVFARYLSVARNKDSDFITALILSLILSPASSLNDLAVLSAAALTAIASKYLLTLGRRHIFNPAAAGAFVVGQFFHHYASWWVGTKFSLIEGRSLRHAPKKKAAN